MSLSARIRPVLDASLWVCKEVERLERKLAAANAMLDEVRQNCTRDDDLPELLLLRIDAHLA
jgi:hypothetical protein